MRSFSVWTFFRRSLSVCRKTHPGETSFLRSDEVLAKDRVRVTWIPSDIQIHLSWIQEKRKYTALEGALLRPKLGQRNKKLLGAPGRTTTSKDATHELGPGPITGLQPAQVVALLEQ